MGAAAGYFLSRRGVAVTVVERTGVACAASGKSGGFLALDWCDGSPLGPLARASFALQEAVIVLAHVVRHVRLALVEGHEVRPVHRVTLRPEGGLPMRLTRRV